MDDVLREVRKVREAYAQQFGYDLAAIHRDLKEQEKASGQRVVSLPPRKPKAVTPHDPDAQTYQGVGSADR